MGNKATTMEDRRSPQLDRRQHRRFSSDYSYDDLDLMYYTSDEDLNETTPLIRQIEEEDERIYEDDHFDDVEEEKVECRICKEDIQLIELTDDEKKKVLTPCQCSGNIKYVHFKCLKQWTKPVKARRRNERDKKEKKKCEICKCTYDWNRTYFLEGRDFVEEYMKFKLKNQSLIDKCIEKTIKKICERYATYVRGIKYNEAKFYKLFNGNLTYSMTSIIYEYTIENESVVFQKKKRLQHKKKKKIAVETEELKGREKCYIQKLKKIIVYVTPQLIQRIINHPDLVKVNEDHRLFVEYDPEAIVFRDDENGYYCVHNLKIGENM